MFFTQEPRLQQFGHRSTSRDIKFCVHQKGQKKSRRISVSSIKRRLHLPGLFQVVQGPRMDNKVKILIIYVNNGICKVRLNPKKKSHLY